MAALLATSGFKLKEMTFVRFALFVFCTIIRFGYLSAQEPTFTAQTNLVQVTVRTSEPAIKVLGRDWKPADFQIFDNDARQEIAFFQSVQVALDLAVIPVSGGGIGRLQHNQRVQELRDALGLLQTEDSVAVVRSSPCPKGSVVGQDRNQTVRELFGPIRHRPMPFGEALECASKILRGAGAIGRAKAILIHSDRYVRPQPDWFAAVNSVLNSDIAVYLYVLPASPHGSSTGRAVTWPPLKTEGRKEDEPTSSLSELVNSSGGMTATWDPKKAILTDLIGLMKRAVILGYYPPKWAGWHTIRVSLSLEVAPHAEALRLFHRSKYYQQAP